MYKKGIFKLHDDCYKQLKYFLKNSEQQSILLGSKK